MGAKGLHREALAWAILTREHSTPPVPLAIEMENIEAALKEAEKVAKRQRACASKSADSLNKLILEVTEARKQLSAPGAGVSDVFNALEENLSKGDVVKDIADNTKELHGAVNKLGKVCVRISTIMSMACLIDINCRYFP